MSWSTCPPAATTGCTDPPANKLLVSLIASLLRFVMCYCRSLDSALNSQATPTDFHPGDWLSFFFTDIGGVGKNLAKINLTPTCSCPRPVRLSAQLILKITCCTLYAIAVEQIIK